MASVVLVGCGGGTDSAKSTNTKSTIPAMDPSATQAAVIASLQNSFCGGKSQTNDFSPVGYILLTCDMGAISANAHDIVTFYVYGSPTALQVALASSLSCVRGISVVAGPSWYAQIVNTSTATQFVNQGARILSCGQ